MIDRYMILEQYDYNDEILEMVISCKGKGHIHQVAFTIHHETLTQICFSCGRIRTRKIIVKEAEE